MGKIMNLYKYTFKIISDYDKNFASTKLVLLKYPIIKETPYGHWIKYWNKQNKKWVPKTGGNLFAYTTEAWALDNFIQRKRRQIGLIKFNLKRIEEAKKLAEDLIKQL